MELSPTLIIVAVLVLLLIGGLVKRLFKFVITLVVLACIVLGVLWLIGKF